METAMKKILVLNCWVLCIILAFALIGLTYNLMLWVFELSHAAGYALLCILTALIVKFVVSLEEGLT